MRSRVFALAIGLVIAALVPLGGEWRARRLDATWSIVMAPDEPGRKYRLRPGQFFINADGFRERELPFEPPEGALRVVLLGDSVSFGAGMELEQVAGRVAEARLQAGGLDAQVVNLSVHGYDVEQIAATLRHRGWRYQPDLVVYAAYTNDGARTRVTRNAANNVPAYVGNEPFEGLPEALGRWLQAHSSLFRRWRAARWLRAVDEGRVVRRTWDPAFFTAHLAAMSADARDHGVPLVVWGLGAHVLAETDPGACFSEGQGPDFCAAQLEQMRNIRDAAVALGLPCVNALGALRASGAHAFFPEGAQDPHHPGVAGHAVFGADLADVVQRWQAGQLDARVDVLGAPPPRAAHPSKHVRDRAPEAAAAPAPSRPPRGRVVAPSAPE
ncbi:MAG: hypothetical protein H6739_24560 [Alphaproteobacteria bacterium]|nr:hypothetical protein [Alphaproteobacteria bacterium]